MVIFLHDLYNFVGIQYGCSANTVLALESSNSVINKLWCITIKETNNKEMCF